MVTRMPRLTRLQAMTKPQACRTLIWPDATGRIAVRATLASMSRSTMSLKAQPAARISAAPIANSASSRGPGQAPCIAAARAMACQPGSISSQIPAGRSNRPSFSQGRKAWGAWRSTQLSGAASGRARSWGCKVRQWAADFCGAHTLRRASRNSRVEGQR